MPNPSVLATHLKTLAGDLVQGKVVPFIGAGVHLCGRPAAPVQAEKHWWYGTRLLPKGDELARYLAEKFEYEDAATNWDLMRVSQFAEVMQGSGPLYETLQELFARDYQPTPLHRLLARVPALLRERGIGVGLPLIITTNYDEVLEAAFYDQHEPFDLVSYLIRHEGHSGKFWHLPQAHEHFAASRQPTALLEGAPWQLIESPNTYAKFPTDGRTIIFKIHGAVDRAGADQSSFVITEDDYIDYLARMDFANPLPKLLALKMKFARLLFLGYGLRDWNLRVVLQRIWGERNLTYPSWSIQLGAQESDKRAWQRRNVSILDIPLEEYVPELEKCITGIPSRAAPAVAAP
ncbi:MAG TPA: SIR2 family protein [Chthoniobacterales bacterium]